MPFLQCIYAMHSFEDFKATYN